MINITTAEFNAIMDATVDKARNNHRMFLRPYSPRHEYRRFDGEKEITTYDEAKEAIENTIKSFERMLDLLNSTDLTT